MSKQIHIAVDLDGTLASWTPEFKKKYHISQIGPIIEPMKQNIINWLKKGYKVTIFTARLDEINDSQYMNQFVKINNWLRDNGLPELNITATKSKYFTHFIDDKAYHCKINVGDIIELPEELK